MTEKTVCVTCLSSYGKAQLKKMFENITDRLPVITLCGSTRFKDMYEMINRRLTLDGYVVISVGVYRNDIFDIEQYRDILTDVHKQKIDMADAIYVINKDGYIGEHVEAEIKYAKSKGKIILYMEQC